jgi:hypothetical protein
MLKRTLIAIAVVAVLAGSAYAAGPDPHTGTVDGKYQSIKVNMQKLEIGWPFEYKALDLCVIPVYMNVGYYVQVKECNKRKIKLVQVNCDDIGKKSSDWPCYKDCEDVQIRANFVVKLGLKREITSSALKGSGYWKAYYQGDDTVPGDGNWKTVKVCVEAWEAQLQKETPGSEVEVGKVTVTVKPNV